MNRVRISQNEGYDQWCSGKKYQEGRTLLICENIVILFSARNYLMTSECIQDLSRCGKFCNCGKFYMVLYKCPWF